MKRESLHLVFLSAGSASMFSRSCAMSEFPVLLYIKMNGRLSGTSKYLSSEAALPREDFFGHLDLLSREKFSGSLCFKTTNR